jgi:hypothetical protein
VLPRAKRALVATSRAKLRTQSDSANIRILDVECPSAAVQERQDVAPKQFLTVTE